MCFPVPILNFSSLAVVNGHAKEFTGTFRLEALLYLVEAQVWQKCSWLLKCRYKNLATNFLQVALKKDVCCLLWYACMNSYEPYLSQYSPPPHTHTNLNKRAILYHRLSWTTHSISSIFRHQLNQSGSWHWHSRSAACSPVHYEAPPINLQSRLHSSQPGRQSRQCTIR